MSKKKDNESKIHTLHQEDQITIYIGPTIASLGLRRHTTYIGGINNIVDEVKKISPMAGILFVPLAEFTFREKRVFMSGTLEHMAFNELKKGV